MTNRQKVRIILFWWTRRGSNPLLFSIPTSSSTSDLPGYAKYTIFANERIPLIWKNLTVLLLTYQPPYIRSDLPEMHLYSRFFPPFGVLLGTQL